MLRNNLTIALRTLKRHPGYTAISVLGLAIGLASCLLIGLYVHDELSYDRHHAKADRIVRVAMDVVDDRTLEVTPTIVGPAFERTFPEVEESARLYDIGRYNSVVVRHADRAFQEEGFFYADSTVFDVFSHSFVKGTPEEALTRPYTIVLTQSAAQRYFGGADPVGQTLTVGGDRTFEVTGVIADPPSTSHLQFDFLASFVTTRWAQREIWSSANFYTYLLLQEGTVVPALQDKVTAVVDQQLGEARSFIRGLRLQPLTAIHLYANGHVTYVYLFGAIALLILGIAGVNFTNIATAQSIDRAREVGVRKTLGAVRSGLVGQFLVEAMLLAVGAACIAALLAEAALPFFRWLTGKALTQGVVGNGSAIALLMSVAGITGLAAGSYPAFVLARFRPAAVLKGAFSASPHGRGVRKALVTFQFAVTVALLAGTAVVYQQLDFVQTTNLGFEKEQVVVLPLSDNDAYPALRQVLQQQPDVRHVAAVSAIPGEEPGGYTAQVPGRPDGGERPSVAGIRADAGVVEALGLDLLAGTGLPASRTHDPQEQGYAYLVNETLVRRLGWTPREALGRRFAVSSGRAGTVVGVVADFHQASLHREIMPLVFFTEPGTYDNVLVKVNTDDVPATLARIEATWQQVAPATPFAHRFLDEAYDALYRAEMRTGRVFATFSGLAILIACLGLFGLAAIAARQRTREIGIRKALGASASSLVALLSKEFLQLVGIAIGVAVPVAYWGMQRWLADFAYRVDIGAGVFLAAGGIALAVALGTVGVQAWRAARLDPTKVLRSE